MHSVVDIIISRFSSDDIAEFIGKDVVKYIEMIKGIKPKPRDLIDILFKNITPIELFRKNTEFKNKFFRKLRTEQAKNICLSLGYQKDNYFEFLSSYDLSNKKNLKNITNFLNFDYELSTQIESDESSNEIKFNTAISSQYSLFEHQSEIYIKVRDSLRVAPHRVLMHMPTGSGKTRTAMNILADFLRNNEFKDKSILWIADRNHLCEQAALEFEQAWSYLGNNSANVIRLYSEKSKNLDINQFNNGSSFIVSTIQFLLSLRNNQNDFFINFIKKIGMIVFDETHLIIADQYKEIIEAMTPSLSTYLLGLTATPGRSYINMNEDRKLSDFFNNTKYTLKVKGYENPIEYLIDEGYLSKVDTETIDYESKNLIFSDYEKQIILEGKNELSDDRIQQICEEEGRRALIFKKIIECSQENKGNKILVFASSVKEANLFADVLKNFNIKIFAITDKTNSQNRNYLINEFKKPNSDVQILTNYGVLSTGFDAPKTNIAIITRPISSVILYNQIVGRVARGPKAGGNEKCKIIQVVDKGYGFRDLSESFLFWEDIW